MMAIPWQEQSPAAALVGWFDELPAPQQHYLAYMVWLTTTQNSADLSISTGEAVKRLRAYMQEPDFPIRVIARIVQLRGLLDFFIEHQRYLPVPALEQPFLEEQGALPAAGNVHSLQWERTRQTWRDLCKSRLPDTVLRRWLRHSMEAEGG